MPDNIMNAVDYIKRVYLDSSWLPDKLKRLPFLSNSKYEYFPPKYTIIHQHSHSEKFYVIISGEVEKTKISTTEGKHQTTTISDGRSFGGKALLLNQPCEYSVKTISNCHTLSVTAAKYLQIIYKKLQEYNTELSDILLKFPRYSKESSLFKCYLCGLFKREERKKDQWISLKGTDYVYLVLSGSVQVFTTIQKDKKKMRIRVLDLERGSLFGEKIFHCKNYSFKTVRQTVLYHIKYNDFTRFFCDSTNFACNNVLLNDLSKRAEKHARKPSSFIKLPRIKKKRENQSMYIYTPVFNEALPKANSLKLKLPRHLSKQLFIPTNEWGDVVNIVTQADTYAALDSSFGRTKKYLNRSRQT